MKKTIFVSAPFPKELDRQSRIAAARQRISRAALIRQAVIEYLAKLETQAAQPESETGHDR